MNANILRTIVAGCALLAPAFAHAQEVLGREHNQQQRISQGIASGQITATGAARLERREARINASRHADLAASLGHLTPGETYRLNARENAASNRIYADKHNDIAQPGVIPH